MTKQEFLTMASEAYDRCQEGLGSSNLMRMQTALSELSMMDTAHKQFRRKMVMYETVTLPRHEQQVARYAAATRPKPPISTITAHTFDSFVEQSLPTGDR